MENSLSSESVGVVRSILLGSEADIESEDEEDLYGDLMYDSYPRYKTGILGVSYERNLSERTFAKLTAGFQYNRRKFSRGFIGA